MAKAEKAMLDKPNAYECSFDLKIGISLRQIQRLDEIAKQRKDKNRRDSPIAICGRVVSGRSTQDTQRDRGVSGRQPRKGPLDHHADEPQRRLNVLLPN